MRHCHSFIQMAGYCHDYKKEMMFHKFWNVPDLTNRRTHHCNSFAISAFEKTFVEKRYNLFSHWNGDRERLSRFVNTAKHISWHPPKFNSRPLLFDTPIKFSYSNRGLTREVRFSISIWEVRTKNGFKFWTTKSNLDSRAKRLTWFECKSTFYLYNAWFF